jgi:plasmid maintenance system killer protein
LGDIQFLDFSKNKNVLENKHSKQLGTLNLWREALQKIRVNDDSTMVFIAGRYTLTENFKMELNSDYAFKKENSS